MDATDGLEARLQAVRSRIADAARASGRDAAEITTVVVTKFHPPELVAALAELGVRDVGESRHQEASVKAAALAGLGLTWHFIGQLQSKKAKAVCSYARVIHSLDRESLLTALASGGREESGADVGVFLQVNLDDADDQRGQRGGVMPDAVEPLAEKIMISPGVNLVGVMGVAPLGAAPRAAFARLREASETVRGIAPAAVHISAGMSDDFAEAIAEGATHLRIGTAITGNRPVHG